MSVSMKFVFGFVTAIMLAPGLAVCSERPTMNVTRDPRPDILAHPLYYAHTEYRREYNRPRYITGWLAQKIAPTSQEAMVWCENVRAGSYDERNMPPRYKRYFGPKPWEVLQTAERPDFTRPTPSTTAPSRRQPAAEVEEYEALENQLNEPASIPESSRVPAPIETTSPTAP